MKIFLLPKCATQSPRSAVPGDAGTSRPTSVADRSITARIEEMPAVQPLPARLTFADVDPERVFRFASRTRRRVVDRRAPRALTSVRQHFLKLDAVFFDVLVYSGWCASRFPSARSD